MATVVVGQCDCCGTSGEPCDACLAGASPVVLVEISGITNGDNDCTQCASINGAYVLNFIGQSTCTLFGSGSYKICSYFLDNPDIVFCLPPSLRQVRTMTLQIGGPPGTDNISLSLFWFLDSFAGLSTQYYEHIFGGNISTPANCLNGTYEFNGTGTLKCFQESQFSRLRVVDTCRYAGASVRITFGAGS